MAASSGRGIVLRLLGLGEVEVVEGLEELKSVLGRELAERIPLCEAVLLVVDGKAELVDKEGRKLTVEEAVAIASRYNPEVWVKVEVYMDLKRRGRIVVPGPRHNTLLVKLRKRSPNYDYYVLVTEERRPIKLSLITSFIEEASKNGWTPLIAVVDAYGDVTYYTPSRFTARRVAGSEGTA